MRTAVILAGLCAFIMIGLTDEVSAKASAGVSAECWAHLAEIPADQKTTPAGDRRYHLEHGEFSPCTEQDAQQDQPHESANNKDTNDDKSRYCRKRWFC